MSAVAAIDADVAIRDGDALTARLRREGVSPWQMEVDEHVRPIESSTALDSRDAVSSALQAEIVLPARLPRRVLGFLPGHSKVPRLALPTQQPVGTTHASSTRAGPLISENWPLSVIDRERRVFDRWLETFAPMWQSLPDRQRRNIEYGVVWHVYLDVPDGHAEDGRATASSNAREPAHLRGLLDTLRTATGAWQPLSLPFEDEDGDPRAAFGERTWIDGDDVVVDTVADWDLRHAAASDSDDGLYMVRLRIPREPLLQALVDVESALDALQDRVSRVAGPDAIRSLAGAFD